MKIEMKQYKIVIFDLDGTLTDSALGITNSLIYALGKCDIQVADRTELYKFIGPPLTDSFMEYYHFSHEEAVQASVFYDEYFRSKGIFENKVYDGVLEMLTELNERGIVTAVASAKPEIDVKKILRHFGLNDFFRIVGGSDSKTNRMRKEDVLRYALKFFHDVDKKDILMVGDRQDDVIGAKKNGLNSVGVLYGFGSQSELQAAGADYIVETVVELHRKLVRGL